MITFSTLSLSKEIFFRSMKKYRCFLCQLLSDDEFALLAHIQYEVGLPNSLAADEIIQDGGFCTYHFHELLRISNTTYLSRFLTKFANDFVQNRIKLLGLWKANCQLCNFLLKKETDYIRTFS